MKRFFLILVLLVVFVRILPAQSTIFIVRHAEKSEAGDTKDPDLSEAGRARAAALAGMLKDAEISAIYATEYKRTRQTAAPIAEVLRIAVTQVPAKETDMLIAQLRTLPGNALVVGHSNTLPEIIKALGVATPITIGDHDYDDLFMITAAAPPRFVHLHLASPSVAQVR